MERLRFNLQRLIGEVKPMGGGRPQPPAGEPSARAPQPASQSKDGDDGKEPVQAGGRPVSPAGDPLANVLVAASPSEGGDSSSSGGGGGQADSEAAAQANSEAAAWAERRRRHEERLERQKSGAEPQRLRRIQDKHWTAGPVTVALVRLRGAGLPVLCMRAVCRVGPGYCASPAASPTSSSSLSVADAQRSAAAGSG
jgi:hypothetical protein